MKMKERRLIEFGRSGSACMALLLIGLASFAGAQSITEFVIPTAVSNPFGIAPGPDGNLWFTESNGGKIGRITPSGAVTEFSLPTAPGSFGQGQPLGIAAGPDGALWFTEQTVKRVGRITTAGAVTEFTLTVAGTPQYVTAGPDGSLWFTEAPNRIARVSPSDPNTIVEYPTLLPATTLAGLTSGPDGNIWFTETDHASGSARIAQIDLAKLDGCSANPSLCITEFPVPGGESVITGIASGPDGALWFTTGGKVNRITTGGVITQFNAASASNGGITRGPDGALWYAGTNNKIGRITTAGVLTEFQVPTAGFSPRGITAGPDGNIWFVEITANKIGRLTTGVATGCVPGLNTLCLNNGRFKVTVAWRVPPQGTSGAGNAVSLTGDTGYFWFFSANNVELIVKVVDGRAFNNYFWVFFGALSDVEYTITVTDTATGATRTYSNTSGHLTSASDTAAFPSLTFAPPEETSGASPTPPASEMQERPAETEAACMADATTLCLNNGRFQVHVEWSVPSQGTSGPGMATSITGDTGHYWFFSSNNIELIIKVVDGRAVNNRFWFFSGALTNVAYTITITDTQTGTVKVYENPFGSQVSLADTDAF